MKQTDSFHSLCTIRDQSRSVLVFKVSVQNQFSCEANERDFHFCCTLRFITKDERVLIFLINACSLG